MCGISGIVDYEGKTDRKLYTGLMLRSIGYRGPDESGIFHSRHATIGNVRLSIIDIAGGQQPLCDPTSRYWITFNGEIFNYRELRYDLEKQGTTFRTHSDTEVLLQLYAKYGHQCLNLLNGQYAFAVWDKQEEELFIARDRMGIRPFFYNINNGVFTFWTSITPYTAFNGIFELSPGHYGYFSRKGFRTERYWLPDFGKQQKIISLPETLERFNDLFNDAVRIRLRADVEVAAYLSGGIDSSATVSYIRDIEPGVLNTFSIGFSEKDFDESHYQNEAVKYFNTRHKSYTCTSEEIAEAFPRVIWHAEMPLTRTAPAPMLLLSKLVRENNIKVVVTGEGSDEMLAGYDIFKEAMIRKFWASNPDSSLRPLLLRKLYPYIPQIAQANVQTLKMFFRYRLEDTSNPFYSHLLRWNNSNHIRKHFSGYMKDVADNYSPTDELARQLPADFNQWDTLARAQWLEATIFMSGYLLSSQGDRMSMANSVEGRYPFLDYRVIEFCNSLPSDVKLKGLTEKYLLKKLLKNRIPDDIVTRTKQPYRAPVNNVFLSDKAPDYVREMLSESQTQKAGIFSYRSVSMALSRIRKTGITSEMDDMLLTSIISTHLLYSQFVENRNEIFRSTKPADHRIIEDLEPALT